MSKTSDKLLDIKSKIFALYENLQTNRTEHAFENILKIEDDIKRVKSEIYKMSLTKDAKMTMETIGELEERLGDDIGDVEIYLKVGLCQILTHGEREDGCFAEVDIYMPDQRTTESFFIEENAEIITVERKKMD